ncbi:hypothetical protein DENSPDRAFT_707835 [Dentipellis sp. KUC8613]|nr:hypothetical protein DENSPDRAFT_707835 [Dentipellis sp. KUC8613]
MKVNESCNILLLLLLLSRAVSSFCPSFFSLLFTSRLASVTSTRALARRRRRRRRNCIVCWQAPLSTPVTTRAVGFSGAAVGTCRWGVRVGVNSTVPSNQASASGRVRAFRLESGGGLVDHALAWGARPSEARLGQFL